jgi:hypothetical protein
MHTGNPSLLESDVWPLIPLADDIENKLSPQYQAVAVADLD